MSASTTPSCFNHATSHTLKNACTTAMSLGRVELTLPYLARLGLRHGALPRRYLQLPRSPRRNKFIGKYTRRFLRTSRYQRNQGNTQDYRSPHQFRLKFHEKVSQKVAEDLARPIVAMEAGSNFIRPLGAGAGNTTLLRALGDNQDPTGGRLASNGSHHKVHAAYFYRPHRRHGSFEI